MVLGVIAAVGGAVLQYKGVKDREKAQSEAGNNIALANAAFFKKKGQVASGTANRFRDLGKAFGAAVQSKFESRVSEQRVRQSQKAFDEREASVNSAIQEQMAMANLEAGAAGGGLSAEQQKSTDGTRDQAQPLEQALVGASAAEAGRSERDMFDLEQSGILSRALGDIGAQASQVQGLGDIQVGQLGLNQQQKLDVLGQALDRAGDKGSGSILAGQLLGAAGQFAQSAASNSELKKARG